VAYLPGLAMRRIADLHPGAAKTDARDAALIASARTDHAAHSAGAPTRRRDGRRANCDVRLRRRPRRPDHRDEQSDPWSAHPDPPCVGARPRAEAGSPGVLDLLETWSTPAALAAAGKTRMQTRLLKKAPRLGGRLTEEIFAALAAQTVVVTGTNVAARGPAAAGRSARGAASTTRRGRPEGRGTRGGAPSFQGPDDHARRRRQDLRTHPPRLSARTSPLPGISPPTPAWPLLPADPGSPSAANTHPAAATRFSTRPVLVRVRGPERPRLPGQLRPETSSAKVIGPPTPRELALAIGCSVQRRVQLVDELLNRDGQQI
jgi:hypothetical protein